MNSASGFVTERLTFVYLTFEASDMTDRPFTNRISPLWLGLGVGAVLLAALFVTETALGRWSALTAGGEFDALARVSSGVLRDLRIAIVHCLVAGYVSAALLHVLRNARRTVGVLQEALNCTPEECDTLAASLRLSVRGLVITGVIAFLVSLLSPYVIPPVPPNPWDPSAWPPEVYWHRILGPITLVLQVWLGYAIVTVSLRMSRIARRLQTIDLLDLSPLAPFTRFGLTNALLLIGLLSIWSLMMIETGFGQMLIIIGGITLTGSVLTIVAPARGVHLRIRQSKEIELGWINAAITKRRAALQVAKPTGGGETADLIAYRKLIEEVPDWPFTTSTYMRLALYLFIPIVSWGIGIVAEELINRVLF